TATSQTAYDGTRRRAGMSCGEVRAVWMAKTTTVMIPESRSSSASIQTAKVETNCTITDVATSSTLAIVRLATQERARARTPLPAEASARRGTALQPEKAPVIAVATARR